MKIFKHKVLLLVAIIGVLISIIAYSIINSVEENRINSIFERAAADRIYLIKHSIEMSELVTESLKNLYLASEEVSREEFHNFISSYREKISGIQSIEWIPRVLDANKDNFIREAKKNISPNFDIVELDGSEIYIPARKRTEYYPILYMEPDYGNNRKIGFDCGSDMIMNAALETAKNQKKLIATERIKILGSKENAYGVILFDPIFKIHSEGAEPDEHQKEFLGFASGIFNVKEIVNNSVGLDRSQGIDIHLMDESAPAEKQLLFSYYSDSTNRIAITDYDLGIPKYTEGLTLGGRQWSITCAATEIFIARNYSILSLLILFAGLTLTGFFLVYNYRILEEKETVSKLVKERTAELNESNERLDLTLNGADLGIWDWNIKTGDLYVNERWTSMLGYNPDDIVPNVESWRKIRNEEDVDIVNQAVNNHLEGKTSIYSSEYRVLTKSGQWKWIMDVGKVFERDINNNPIRAIGIHMDISERKDIQNKILEYNKRLKKDNSDKNRLFSIIGHDLKSPLISIKGFAEFLSTEISDLTQDEIVKYSKYIHQASNSLHSMLEGLLDWGQMQIGKTHFSPEYSELTKLTENVVNQFLVIALSKKINLINNVKNGLTIYADPSMIETVLRNLISNAIKFTPIDGKVTIDAVNSSDDYVIVSVSDTGIGIDKDKLESLFKDSFNTSTLGTEGEKGTGLGLSLSKDFIEKNGGKIWAESEIEKGTAFFFSIPIKETNHN